MQHAASLRQVVSQVGGQAARTNKVVDGGIHGLLAHEPVAPLLLHIHHGRRELAPRQVNGLAATKQDQAGGGG